MSDLPISRRRAETRHRLMEAALGVLADRGVLAASVEEICDQAGFTRGAFYSNFESKNDLVLALLQQEAAQTHAMVDRLAQSELAGRAGDDLSRLTSYAEQAIRTVLPTRRRDRVWVMAVAEMRLYAAREPGIRDAYLAFRRQSKSDLLNRLMVMAQDVGWEFTIPPGSAVEVLDALYERASLKAIMLDPEGNRPDLTQEALTPYIDMMKALIRPAVPVTPATPGASPESEPPASQPTT